MPTRNIARVITISQEDLNHDPELQNLVDGAIREFNSRRLRPARTHDGDLNSKKVEKTAKPPAQAAAEPTAENSEFPVATVLRCGDDAAAAAAAAAGDPTVEGLPVTITMPDGAFMLGTGPLQADREAAFFAAREAAAAAAAAAAAEGGDAALTRWQRVKRWWRIHRGEVAKVALLIGVIAVVAGVAVFAPVGALILVAGAGFAIAAGEAMLVSVDGWWARKRAREEAAAAAASAETESVGGESAPATPAGGEVTNVPVTHNFQ